MESISISIKFVYVYQIGYSSMGFSGPIQINKWMNNWMNKQCLKNPIGNRQEANQMVIYKAQPGNWTLGSKEQIQWLAEWKSWTWNQQITSPLPQPFGHTAFDDIFLPQKAEHSNTHRSSLCSFLSICTSWARWTLRNQSSKKWVPPKTRQGGLHRALAFY